MTKTQRKKNIMNVDTNTTTSGISKSVAAIEVKQTESREKRLFDNVGGTTKMFKYIAPW